MKPIAEIRAMSLEELAAECISEFELAVSQHLERNPNSLAEFWQLTGAFALNALESGETHLGRLLMREGRREKPDAVFVVALLRRIVS